MFGEVGGRCLTLGMDREGRSVAAILHEYVVAAVCSGMVGGHSGFCGIERR